MKQIFFFFLLIFSCSVNAEIIRDGNNFKVEQTTNNDKLTRFTYTDSKGNTYPVYVSTTGKFFVWKTSKKTGKEYKYYLPKEVQEQMKLAYEMVNS